MGTDTRTLETLANREYKWGFVTEIDADAAPKGLNEDIIRLISTKKNEPEFMLEWRLKAYGYWSKLEKEQNMMPSSVSFSLYVVATETLSNTASTATPASRFCSSSGMPSFS